MVAGDARFVVSSLEVERPGLSYTVDTVRHFRQELPDADRFLLLGSDVVSTFNQWREPAEVVRLAQPVILSRGDADSAAPIVLGGGGRPAIGELAYGKLAEAPGWRRVALRELGSDLWESYERA